jgi:hypothetical protein
MSLERMHRRPNVGVLYYTTKADSHAGFFRANQANIETTGSEATQRQCSYSPCARGAPCAGTHKANYFPRHAPDSGTGAGFRRGFI